ncbi:hypothetical protein [Rubrolithibacter danxiaensis]|uniref:hypothetical protein n=1 Tax=Rubrolithibacter danxiaensis TaxID=3390805 RepID=UPI003BF878CB
MNNQFDEKLVNRIRDVFDNYEDTNADLGWMELRKKFPAKNNRRTVLWWMSTAAAVLLLISGIWVFKPETLKNNNKIKPETYSSNKPAQPAEENKTSEETNNTQSLQPVQSLADNDERSTVESTRVVAKSHEKLNTSLAYHKQVPVHEDKVTVSSAIQTPAAAELNPGIETEIPVQPKATTPETAIAQNTSPVVKKQTSLADIHENKKEAEKKKEKAADKKISLEVFAGSFVNYSEGSDNKLNLGAGISTDFAIAKNLKLSAGISITQNQLSYKQDIPPAAANSFNASYNNADRLLGVNMTRYDLNQYDADLLGLDIPINLKYSFGHQKNEYYVSAGFSSGTFLNESYTYHYSSTGPGDLFVPNASTVTNSGLSDKSSTGFDIARMLNVSVGLGYPVGKQNKLILEPFLRYPLKSVGEENLRFGAGGINLKFNFKSFK